MTRPSLIESQECSCGGHARPSALLSCRNATTLRPRTPSLLSSVSIRALTRIFVLIRGHQSCSTPFTISHSRLSSYRTPSRFCPILSGKSLSPHEMDGKTNRQTGPRVSRSSTLRSRCHLSSTSTAARPLSGTCSMSDTLRRYVNPVALKAIGWKYYVSLIMFANRSRS